MGSKISKGKRPSKAKRPTSVKTEVVIVPRIPQEIIDEILDHLSAGPDSSLYLQACALVSKSWVPSCRRHLFHTILFTPEGMARWLKTFPVPEESPARRVRDLRFSIGADDVFPEALFEYTPCFTNVERVTVVGNGMFDILEPEWTRLLSQSSTSLTFGPDTFTTRPVQIRDVMAQLSGSDDLALSGPLVWTDKRALLWIEAVLRGKFSGELGLFGEHVAGGVVDTLLDIPTGLHFTELNIHSLRECLLSTVRLTEACSKTLVRLVYRVSLHYDCEAFERSFDFSEFPNLQEMWFWVSWMGGGLFWIPIALSTLGPATSPHLSAIQLGLFRSPTVNRSVETALEDTGDDLRRVAGEVARIEREFKGAVEATVFRDEAFKAVMDTLDIPRSVEIVEMGTVLPPSVVQSDTENLT